MEQRREKQHPDKQRPDPGEQRNPGERPFGQGARRGAQEKHPGEETNQPGTDPLDEFIEEEEEE